MMKYFRYFWDECQDGEFSDWGKSEYLIEVDEGTYVVRQIEIYENGKILKYSLNHLFDKYGMLADKKVEFDTKELQEISKRKFEQAWKTLTAFNQ